MKATISTVKIGHLEFEGLLLDDGTFAIAIPQVCSTFQFANEHASRDLKAILGAGFQFAKVCTTLNPKAVNCITLLPLQSFKFVVHFNSPMNTHQETSKPYWGRVSNSPKSVLH